MLDRVITKFNKGKFAEVCTLWIARTDSCHFAPPAKPSAPQNLKVKDTGRTDVTLTWEAPASDGGAKVTGYIIEKQEGVDGEWVLSTMTKKTNIKITGLTADTLYNFR